MGKYFLYKDGFLIQTGSCPDGDEKLQVLPGTKLGLGIPPENLMIKTLKVDHASAVKFKRNQLLLECDWTQLPDVPSETKEKWAKYRQELRDITDQVGYPENVVFPSKPN